MADFPGIRDSVSESPFLASHASSLPSIYDVTRVASGCSHRLHGKLPQMLYNVAASNGKSTLFVPYPVSIIDH